MRFGGALILAVVFLALLAPYTIRLHAPGDTDPSLVTIDVCKQSAPSLSSTADGPVLVETACGNLPLAVTGYIAIETSAVLPFYTGQQLERPPRV